MKYYRLTQPRTMTRFFSALLISAGAFCAPVFAQDADFSSGDSSFSESGIFSFGGDSQANSKATSVELLPNAASVPAGSELKVLAKISMEPHWHVYWKNPGEAGMPLSIEWQGLPAGISFGEWSWSTPKYYELQGLGSYVYENVAYVEIPVIVGANVPTGKITLNGTASWLACDDNGCFPQDKAVSFEITVVPAGEKAVPANAEAFAEAAKMLPTPSEETEASYAVNGDSVSVSVKTGFSADARFFPEGEKFSIQAASVVPTEVGGAMTFVLPLNEGEEIKSDRDVAGVLVYADGTSHEVAPVKASGTADAFMKADAEPFSLNAGFFGLLALAFAGGLILNLMPCVFPVLGLKIMHFVGKAGTDRKKIARHGFVFGAGVLISFWILAGVLTVLRSGGEQLGWGFQLQEPGFVYGMILLMLVFGLSMSGVFEFGVGATSVGGSLTEKSGYAGSFFSGVLAVIIATPCAAPFLAPALGSALTLPVVPSFALFTAIAVGLAAPYVVLSCAPALLKFLPKPGGWMETFKQGMAFLLYAPALYFVWVLMGQVEDAFVQRDLLISLSVVALACWIYGRWGAVWRSSASRITGTLVALVLFIGTIIYAGTLLYGDDEQEWVDWTPQAQAEALKDGKTVYIDFTARWCATCQVNKRVYSDKALAKKLDDADVVLMRADWTNKNSTIAAELQKYDRAAVPVNVFLKEGKDPVILGELFAGPGTVADGLEEISAENDKD